MGAGSYMAVKEFRIISRWDGKYWSLLRREGHVIIYIFQRKITLAALQKMDDKKSKRNSRDMSTSNLKM